MGEIVRPRGLGVRTATRLFASPRLIVDPVSSPFFGLGNLARVPTKQDARYELFGDRAISRLVRFAHAQWERSCTRYRARAGKSHADSESFDTGWKVSVAVLDIYAVRMPRPRGRTREGNRGMRFRPTRDALLRSLLSVVVAASAWAGSAPRATAGAIATTGSWSMFQHDQQHTGVTLDPAIGATTAARLEVKWKKLVAKGEQLLASPAVAFNAQLHKPLVYTATDSGTITARDLATGSVVWTSGGQRPDRRFAGRSRQQPLCRHRRPLSLRARCHDRQGPMCLLAGRPGHQLPRRRARGRHRAGRLLRRRRRRRGQQPRPRVGRQRGGQLWRSLHGQVGLRRLARPGTGRQADRVVVSPGAHDRRYGPAVARIRQQQSRWFGLRTRCSDRQARMALPDQDHRSRSKMSARRRRSVAQVSMALRTASSTSTARTTSNTRST